MLSIVKYVFVMALGCLLRRKNLVQAKDTHVLSAIMIRITLPCAMAASVRELEPDGSMFLLSLIALLIGALMLLLGRIIPREKEEQILFMVNLSSLNIGGFAVPFMQGMLSPAAVAFAGMYDIGNSSYGNGISYLVPQAMLEGRGGIRIRDIFRKLCRSVPLVTYLVFLLLTFLRISLPDALFDLLKNIGDCNFLIVFLTAGIVMDLRIDKKGLKTVLKFLMVKYGIGSLLSVLVYLFLPFNTLIRQAVVFCILAPQSSTSVAYGEMLGCDRKVFSTMYTCGLIASMGAYAVLGAIWNL